MAVVRSQTAELITAEWIVDTGTPRHLQEGVEELFNEEADGGDKDVEDLIDADQASGSDETAEKGIRNKFWNLLSGKSSRKTRGVTLGGLQSTRVTVIAPGAGVGANGAVYMELKQDPSLRLKVEGRSGMPYDRYPPAWAQSGGAPAPNLESFAQGILSAGAVRGTDCFIFGSRGGQVVLPTLWRHLGDGVPPAIVINGGCAMDLPITVHWPSTAVTFLVLGGCDYFKKPHLSPQQYVAEAQNSVPKSNSTTAILYVQEMAHMPHPALLKTILRPAITGLTSWKSTGRVPIDCFETIARSLKGMGLSARLLFTCSPGVWQEMGCAPSAPTPAGYPAQVQLPPNAGIKQMVKPAMAPFLAPQTVVGQPQTQPGMFAPALPVAAGSTQLTLAPGSTQLTVPPQTPAALTAPQTVVGQPQTQPGMFAPALPVAAGSTQLTLAPGSTQLTLVSQSPAVKVGPATVTLPTSRPGAVMLPAGPRTVMLPASPSPAILPAGARPFGQR